MSDWNKTEVITVPKGFYGWRTKGRLRYEDKVFRFPVGQATSLPAPVVEHLRKLIELPEEERPEQPHKYRANSTFTTDADGNPVWSPVDVSALTEEMAGFTGESFEQSGRLISGEMVGGSKILVETSAANIVHTGKNLFEVGVSLNDYWRKSSFSSVNPDDQTVSLVVAAGSSAMAVRNTPIPVKAGDSIVISTYCDSHSTNVAQSVAALLDADMNVLTTGCTGTYVDAYKVFL